MRALVIGDSGGIGAAMTEALRQDGVEVTGLSRRDSLDLTDQASVASAAAMLADRRFDLIFNATGALVIDGHAPETTIAAIDAHAMAQHFALNATGVALLLRHFSPLMARGQRAVFASLSARVGSIGDNGLGGWISYRAAKTAQNQIIRTAAIEIARKQKQHIVVALHPGTVATRLSAAYADRHPTISPDESAKALLAVMDRLTPDDTGTFWDWKGKRIAW
ncbi:SDR family NAD(P)-dependent oxidoreductase [Paracoccus zhejiangensis]|uniref:C factor, cell signaling protein n=1 Tax=Paracoccus zhejiangensis TaxID=1077935 RepID=A0A2H5F168_9RHOB|nr:SDR family NAD(P)-dependent oxidoreductase [Paracoccus zhejiangensis]AUH65291.1 C factor, cell signaling protein [Paracoccus zhejiangensis]